MYLFLNKKKRLKKQRHEQLRSNRIVPHAEGPKLWMQNYRNSLPHFDFAHKLFAEHAASVIRKYSRFQNSHMDKVPEWFEFRISDSFDFLATMRFEAPTGLIHLFVWLALHKESEDSSAYVQISKANVMAVGSGKFCIGGPVSPSQPNRLLFYHATAICVDNGFSEIQLENVFISARRAITRRCTGNGVISLGLPVLFRTHRKLLSDFLEHEHK